MSHETQLAEQGEQERRVVPAGRIPAQLPTLADPPTAWPRSFPIDTHDGKAKLLKLSGPPTRTVDETQGEPFNVVGYLMFPASRVDEETGEESTFIRLSLLCEDGSTVATTGPLVCRKWILILQMCGNPTPDRPIPVQLVERKSRRQGRKFHDLELIAPF